MAQKVGMQTLPRDYDATLTNQTNFRVEVAVERLVVHLLIHSPAQGVVPQIMDEATAWQLRGWAVLSLGESLVKTVIAAVALAITYVADKVFGAEWNHDVYGDAAHAHFTSFWLSGLMMFSPQSALNTAFNPTSDEDPTIDSVNIGSQAPGSDPAWGTTGDLAQATLQQKLGIVGPIDLAKRNP